MSEYLKKINKDQKRFWYHYNKPESRRSERNCLTVHWNDECILVNSVKCHVATESYDRRSQPYCIIRGWANDVSVVGIEGGEVIAIIA